MSAPRASREFDQISEVYDATREPLGAPLVESVASTLRGWGVRQLLEVGVGTGRVAGPLSERGFEVSGIDASAGMLARARAKQLPRLVRGNAYRLPFAARALDAALFVHVLHVLDRPAVALGEACRVSRVGAVGLVRPPSGGDEGASGAAHPRRMVVERLRQEGVEVPDRAGGGPHRAERRLLAEIPPARLVTLSEEDVTEPLAATLALFERRASRWTLHVPPEKLARAVAAVREELGDRTHTYHLVRALALWDHAPAVPSEGGPEPTAPTLGPPEG